MAWNARWLVVLVMVVASGFAASAPAAAESSAISGRLDLRGELRIASSLIACAGPGGTTGTCATRSGKGLVGGLGQVSVTYTWRIDLGPPSCSGDRAKALAYDVTLVVAGKGEIRMALAEAADCVDVEAVRNQAQPFSVVSGTGIYAGASGAGTVSRSLSQTASGAAGDESWTGTLDVPGLEFDVTPPTISIPSRRIFLARAKARRARVTYLARALDDRDGDVRVACQPRSGVWFQIGRTAVTCSAADTSGNERTARFVITVKRRR